MATDHSTMESTKTCPWCGRALGDGDTTTVGPPPHLGDRHAFEMHAQCATAWESFIDRVRTLVSRGGRETLLSYPLEHGTDALMDDEPLLEDDDVHFGDDDE